MSKRPLIALMASLDAEQRVCIHQSYLNAIWQAGGAGAVLPYENSFTKTEEYGKEFDGFMFCGGDDIDPKYYGEINTASKNICSIRDEFEFAMLDFAFTLDKPILGICRGAQLINVYLGGTLYQHIENHRFPKEQGECFHEIEILNRAKIFNFVDKSTYCVNSFHHQCVKQLGRDLIVNAKCGDVIEAFCHKDRRYCLGVQWHPERSYDRGLNSSIFEEFINSTKSAQC